MRALIVALTAAVLSSCGPLPSLPGGGDQMLSARDLRSILSEGSVWCYSPDIAAGTCTQVERLGRLERDAFSLDQIFMTQFGDGLLKVESVQNLRIEGNRVCTSFDQQVNTMRFYMAGSDSASIGAGDQLLPQEAAAQLRQVLRDERQRAGDPDETCFGWRVHGRQPWRLEEIDYVDGVAQPEAEATMIMLYPINTDTLRLRAQ
jgi:hypothetical protein